jgi:murein DD-endopeptidase MepM/ murein hydrolase activator NlpD
MASAFVEKVQVAAVTATLVSAGWIVAGAFVLDRAETEAIEAEIAANQTPAPEVSPEAAMAEAEQATGSNNASTPPEEETATLMIPVMGVAASDLVDTFSDGRGGGTRLHEALDISAEEGTSVVASAPGTLERMFRSDAGGNTVYIRSEDRETIYYYAHLGEYAPGLNEGQQVRRGQRLGTVGTIGHAEPGAPHLHFEVMRTTPNAEWWEPATSVNPYPLLVRQR